MKKKNCNSITNCVEEKLLLFEKSGYPIMECKKCNHRFSDVSKTPDHLEKVYTDNYFFGGKAGYPNYLHQENILFNYGIKYAKIIARHAKPGKVLDIGCAAGFILKGFEKSGWNCTGIEPNETMVNYGRKELHLNISTCGLENFKTNQTFDLINMIQVIGHFYDLDKAMQNVTDLLNDNGLVLIESWNMQSKVARLTGKRWHEYSPPSVINWFSEKTLVQLFNYYGFEIVDKGYPAKRINMLHALSLLEEKTPDFKFKKQLIKLIGRVFGKFTFFYPPLDLNWYIFKKTI